MKTSYVVVAEWGSYSDKAYKIEKVFLSEKKAKDYCEYHNNLSTVIVNIMQQIYDISNNISKMAEEAIKEKRIKYPIALEAVPKWKVKGPMTKEFREMRDAIQERNNTAYTEYHDARNAVIEQVYADNNFTKTVEKMLFDNGVSPDLIFRDDVISMNRFSYHSGEITYSYEEVEVDVE